MNIVELGGGSVDGAQAVADTESTANADLYQPDAGAGFRDWLAAVTLTARYSYAVLPLVNAELDGKWVARAAAIPDPELRALAVASITHKRFHCEGGVVYALTPRGASADLAAPITAIQTISDYLDNLCDRSGAGEAADLRRLHGAWMDALTLDPPLGGYYDFHPERDDGGYLAALVSESRTRLHRLPSFGVVANDIARLARLYADLQVYKHLYPIGARQQSLEAWFQRE